MQKESTKEMAARIKALRDPIESVETRLSKLNVFLFFQSIFQTNIHKKRRNGKGDNIVEKGFVRNNPMSASEWAREQSKMPMRKPIKYDGDGNMQADQSWTLLELALDGFFYKHHEVFEFYQQKEVQDAVLEAILRNKADPNDKAKWEGAPSPEQLRNAQTKQPIYTGEEPEEGKIDSCGVIYFAGLFILSEPIEERHFKDKLLAVPRYRMAYSNQDKNVLTQAAVVLPHPTNFNEVMDLVDDIHGLTRHAVDKHGVLAPQNAEQMAADDDALDHVDACSASAARGGKRSSDGDHERDEHHTQRSGGSGQQGLPEPFPNIIR